MSFDLILPFLRPIEGLLLDEHISEIMGNPDSSWWFERDGVIHSAVVAFSSDGLRTGLEVVANKLGKKLDEDNPVLNEQLPDGSACSASHCNLCCGLVVVSVILIWESVICDILMNAFTQ